MEREESGESAAIALEERVTSQYNGKAYSDLLVVFLCYIDVRMQARHVAYLLVLFQALKYPKHHHCGKK